MSHHPFWRSEGGRKSGCQVFHNGKLSFLPLKHLDAKVSILSSTSRTTLVQTFLSPNAGDIDEALYVFPLFDGVSVINFTCAIGSRVITGVVKEREEAKRAFNNAVKRGRTAGLLEQSGEAADVFTVSLGNVPATETVKVEITYLGELKHDAGIDGLRFAIPTSIAPRYGNSSVEIEPSAARDAHISVTVDMELPEGSAIKSIQSPSHPISVNIGTTSAALDMPPSLQRASVNLAVNSAELGKDFILLISATGLGDPVAVLETHPTLANQRALMATLVPRFNLPTQRPEVVFLCDRSGSMEVGNKIRNLVAAMGVFLKSLPVGVKFNICSFGSHFSFLWPTSQPYNQANLDKAINDIKRFAADYGGTEIQQPMEEVFRRRQKDMNLEVFLITDGEVWEQNRMFQSINAEVAKSCGSIRVFSLGIGEDVSHSFIEGVARAGNGFAQTVSADEKMDRKLLRMLKGALTPHIEDNYTLEIRYEKEVSGGEIGHHDHDEHEYDQDDEDFELVEKVMDAMTIDVPVEKQGYVKEGNGAEKTILISLFDQSVKSEDMEMPDVPAPLAAELPAVPEPRYLQTPFEIPPLFPFTRTTVYILLSDHTPTRRAKSIVLRGSFDQTALELEVPIRELGEKGCTIHQLAAKKAIVELEEGRGWIYHAKTEEGEPFGKVFEAQLDEMARHEAVRLGVQYQVGGKWCSFVAIHDGEERGSSATEEGSLSWLDNEMVSASYDGPVSEDEDLMSPQTMMFGGAAPMACGQALAHFPALGVQMNRRPQTQPMVLVEERSFNQNMAAVPQVMNLSKARPQSRKVATMFRRARTAGVRDYHNKSRNKHPDEDEDEDDEEEEEEDKEEREKEGQVHALAHLQTYIGSWAWTAKLEEVLGVSKEQAMGVDLGARYEDEEEVLATLCAVVFLRRRWAEESETWEMFVDKAEEWLAGKTGGDVEALEGIVGGALFV